MKMANRWLLVFSSTLAGLFSVVAFSPSEALFPSTHRLAANADPTAAPATSATSAGTALSDLADDDVEAEETTTRTSRLKPVSSSKVAKHKRSAVSKTKTTKKSTKTKKSSASSSSAASGSGSNPNTSGQTSAGTFTGGAYAAGGYGTVQVKITVASGKITDVAVLQAPNGRSSQFTNYAVPRLVSQALSAQSANIGGAGGASYTSAAFIQSLQSAITKAHL